MIASDFIPKELTNTITDFKITWQTPSNIALVKYWGKTTPQIPKNASISFTLANCHTTTRIEFKKKQSTSQKIEFDFFFEGKKKESFYPKISEFFAKITSYCPYIFEYTMRIYSENSFPHSSGIASSASGMSAIAMGLISFEKALSNDSNTNEYYTKKASFLARLGSGSASRSIEGPLVIWGNHPGIKGSSDLFGVKFPHKIHSIFKDFQDTILLVDKGEKQVSSTVGHNLMHKHPYADQRFLQANDHLTKISEILQNGNIKGFIELVESEALTLHAMMLTSNPYFILMKPNTLEIIHKIWEYRQATNSNLCFTLDAGANVHLLYPKNEQVTVLKFIESQLAKYCQKKHYINDHAGVGAKIIY